MPQFPGGDSAWSRFLADSLRYPKIALNDRIEGTVMVQFIVQPDGTLTDIEAFSGPRELREEAERLMKISPKWIPAKQNKSIVKCYQKQAVKFKLK
jgi:protein TonB